MKLIGITGPARSGKTAVGKILWDEYETNCYGFADPLKAGAMELLGVSDDMVHGENYDREQIIPRWGFSVRYFLQMLGTNVMRDFFREDFWIVRMGLTLDVSDKLREERGTGKGGTCITDVRFENEATFIRKRGGQVWHITRKTTFNSGLDQKAQAHASEDGVMYRLEDRMILNDGTLDELKERVIQLWTQ